MKVFVTGAGGYLGRAACEYLRKDGQEVTGLAHSEESAQWLESNGHAAVRGSLADAELLRARAQAADAVIYAARTTGPQSGAEERAAVEVLLDALADTGKPFVYSSGVWVMGDTRGRLLGEVSGLNPPPMVAWRPAVEEMVLESAARGVKGMVLRPGTVFGRRGGRLAEMFAEARGQGVVRIVGDGTNCWSTVHVEDLADLYCRALADSVAGELFIACGGTPQPVGEIARAVAAACGIGESVERVPLEQARVKLGPLADCLALDCRAGSTKAARYFGWTARKPSIYDEIFRGSYGEA